MPDVLTLIDPTGPDAYYAHARLDILRRVPLTARSVLDVGCGARALGAAIKCRQRAW